MSRLSFFQDILSSVFDRVSPGVASADDRTMGELCNALLTERGELSGNQLAQSILRRFISADEQTQRDIFSMWLGDLDIDPTERWQVLKHMLKTQPPNTGVRSSAILNRVDENCCDV